MNESLSRRQLQALLLAAGSAPVFTLVCSLSWVWVLPAALGTWAVLPPLFRRAAGRIGPIPRAAAAAALFLLAAWAAENTVPAFPETAGSALAAALVLALAGLAAGRGPAVLGRCAGVLVWLLAGLFGTVLIFGLTQVKPAWLRPDGNGTQAGKAFAALLLPAAVLPLRGRTGERADCGPAFGILALLAVSASLVTGGALSPALAAEPMSFLTLAKSVSVLGVVRRFEALISGALLISGFFLCAAALAGLREELLHLAGEQTGRRCYLAALAACLLSLWLRSRIVGLILGITAICCVSAASAPQALGLKNICKKRKKSVDKLDFR